MSSLEVIKRELLKLGLSKDAIELYMSMFGRGPLTIGEISMITKLSFDIIEKELKELLNNELLREIAGTPPRYEALPPLKLFAKGFEHVFTLFRDIENAMKEALDKNLSQIDETTRTTLEKHFEALRNELLRTIDNITSDLKSRVSSVISESITKELSEIKKEVDVMNSTINALYEELIRAEKTAPTDVWIVKGLDGIFAHIKDSISRAKHTVRIVIPHISFLPVDEIEKLPTNVRVYIVADFDPSKKEDREILVKLSDRKFLQIRKTTRKTMISLVTDEKEVLFAPYREGEKENIYGIVAVHEDMVFALRDFLIYAWTTAESVKFP